jgi:hypothetical protein
MKVGRVAIITRGRYAGKKVRRDPDPPRKLSTRMARDERPANERLEILKEHNAMWRNCATMKKIRSANQAFLFEFTGRHYPAR